MSIFGNKTTEKNEEVLTFAGIQPTAESLDMILTESARDSYQIRGGMYISDILMEDAVFEGTATAEVLLEGFGKTLWNKIKEMFTKLWNKLKDWFAKIKRFVLLIFTSGKDFIDKFEKEIRGKSAKGYKYKSFKYTLDAGNGKVDAVIGEAEKLITTYSNGLEADAANVKSKQKEALDNKGDYKSEYNADDEKESILKGIGVDSIEELNEELHKAYRGGEEQPEEFEDFENNSKDEMVKVIKDKDKAISKIDDAQKKIDAGINKIIKAIDGAASKYEGADVEKVTPYASHSTEMLRYAIVLCSAGAKATADAIKSAARDFETILKGYLRFKPAKESFGDDDTHKGSESVLESAMRML